MAAAEAEAAEAAALPAVAEVELTAEQEDLLASFLSDVTQVLVSKTFKKNRYLLCVRSNSG
jgi:hypothetical protein